jgi:hypothetical protein
MIAKSKDRGLPGLSKAFTECPCTSAMAFHQPVFPFPTKPAKTNLLLPKLDVKTTDRYDSAVTVPQQRLGPHTSISKQ